MREKINENRKILGSPLAWVIMEPLSIDPIQCFSPDLLRLEKESTEQGPTHLPIDSIIRVFLIDPGRIPEHVLF